MLDLYVSGQSFLHRCPAGVKLLVLIAVGTVLFLFNSITPIAVATIFAITLYPMATLSLARAWAQVRPAIWILAILFLVQGLLVSWHIAVFIVLRFAALLLLAGLVTLTTRSSDMIDAITRGLHWLRPIGVNPGKVGLAISLALRFIPVLASVTRDVREAQQARGLERSLVATVIPVAVRMLKMADDISDAIDARGYRP